MTKRSKLLRIFSYLRPYFKHELKLLLLMGISVLISLVDPLIIKILIDRVLVRKLVHLLNVLILALIALFALRGIIRVLSGYLYTLIGQRILFDIRNQLFQHLERLHLGFFTNQKTGEILSRINNDVGALQRLSTATFITLFTDLITVAGILGIILLLNWKLTLLSLTVLPFFLYVMFYFGKRIRERSRQVREKIADITSFFEEVFTGIKLVKAHGREDYEAERLERKSEEMIEMRVKLTLLGNISAALIGFLVALGPIVVLWYGGHMVIKGTMSLGSLMAFYAYIGRLFSPVYRLAQMHVEIQSSMAAVDRIFEFLDVRPEIKDKPNAVEPSHVKGGISFENVWFSYDSERYVLRDVSFKIEPFQIVALVGPSGAGKTTITNLICRFYDPQRGRIFLDNYDIRDLKIKSLRDLIGIVTQEPVLFNTSVKENLRYAKPHASDKEIEDAAKKANIHDFIMSLPMGYETVVGDRGVKLSGGQRQRIAIARAILKNPKILIFDEAMSSVDTESERLIREALEPLMKSRTTIVIAHRLSTVVNADKIIVIERGRVIGIGKHVELLAKCDLYRRLCKEQLTIAETLHKT